MKGEKKEGLEFGEYTNTNTAESRGCDFCFNCVFCHMYFCCVLCVPKTTKRKNVIFIHESVLKYLYMYVKFFCIFESMIEIITENYIIHHHTTSLLFYTQNFFILIMYIILNTHLSHLFEADTSTSSQFMLPFAC